MPSTKYRPDIDGLRAIAVSAVVLHHLSASLMPGGFVGVDVFFVISGYLITRILYREMHSGSFTFARFYKRRARRIFPALFAVLAATLAASYFVLLPSDYAATFRGALGTIFFVSNFVFWRTNAAGYFAATDAGVNPLLHTWSLAVEEQFYLLFPVLLLICVRYLRRGIVAVLLVCVAASLAGAAALVSSKSVAVFFLSPFRAWELLVGSLLAVNALPMLTSRAVREVFAWLGLIAIIASSWLYGDKTTFPGLTALAPVLGAAAVMHAGGSGSNFVTGMLQWRPVVYIGLISYSLYLWHWPVIVLARYASGMEPLIAYIPALLVVSLALGSLSYRFIEQPFRHGKITRKILFSSSAAIALTVMLFSVAGLILDGFESRFSTMVVQLDKSRSPHIPFVNCDEKPAGSWCSMGSAEGKVTTLMWGDSHLLAWAPAFEAAMTKRGERAVFVPSSACPPLLGVSSVFRPGCSTHNNDVKNYLLANPDIKTVVLSAFWSAYFSESGSLIGGQQANPSESRVGAVQEALVSTIQWLRENERQAVLIGPVPIYEKNVPLAIALEQATGTTLLHSSKAKQHAIHVAYFDAIATMKRVQGRDFRVLDPIQWMCTDECIVMKDGVSLYRDAHHLSVTGALVFENDIARGIGMSHEARQDSDTPSGNHLRRTELRLLTPLI